MNSTINGRANWASLFIAIRAIRTATGASLTTGMRTMSWANKITTSQTRSRIYTSFIRPNSMTSTTGIIITPIIMNKRIRITVNLPWTTNIRTLPAEMSKRRKT